MKNNLLTKTLTSKTTIDKINYRITREFAHPRSLESVFIQHIKKQQVDFPTYGN